MSLELMIVPVLFTTFGVTAIAGLLVTFLRDETRRLVAARCPTVGSTTESSR